MKASEMLKQNSLRVFGNENAENAARKLVEVLHISNSQNLMAGMEDDELYGPAYKALKNLLYRVFGKDVTDLAMNCNTWCVSDFDGQIVPAIEWAIDEMEERSKRGYYWVVGEKNYFPDQKAIGYFDGTHVTFCGDDILYDLEEEGLELVQKIEK